MMAANSIRSGEYEVIVAGGMESMTNAPYFGKKISKAEFGEMKPTMIHDGLWDVYIDEHMGNSEKPFPMNLISGVKQQTLFLPGLMNWRKRLGNKDGWISK